ncbi:MAG: D-alanyl-D-alanine carboxypeptidase family protein [Fibrella sp.]|nr:D-alanyl-D-alanine carboxypeptidase family protein [Armatimonadota bacterium]
MKPNFDLSPIPFIHELPDWGRLPIADNDEPLVPVPLTGRLRGHSMYFEMQIPAAAPTITVRAGVLDRLQNVVASLPESVSLIVFDGYRPLAVQQWLWDNYLAKIIADEPHLSPEEAERKVRQFVAFPAPDPLRPPPHRTGGAVDVYLVETETSTELPMGTPPDAIAPESVTRHFEDVPAEPFTTNRRLLWHAMTNAGFANYPGEWWHFEYGNQRWANITGAEVAVYGLPGDGEIGL